MAKQEVFMGIDINPGSSPASIYRPRYSLIIVDSEGKVVYKNEEATLPRIIRLAWEYRVSRIGIDNIYELATSEQGIARILALLPPGVELLQVTYESGRFKDIRSIAEKHGVIMDSGKLSPGKTAYIAAQLARLGVGGKVRLREEKTRIIISKARATGKGGWSQARYRRRINSVISQVAQQVKETLDRAGLDYDESYRRSKGGIETATFTVYAGREKLYGLIRPYEGRDYRIRITPLYSTRILIGDHDVAVSHRPIIVGVDPGMYTGIAVLDVSGNLLWVYSSRSLDRSKIASILGNMGKPVIIATDVNPPPETVRKLAAMFDAELYAPHQNLSTFEKRMLADEVYPDYEDTHQRDAIAAAYKAYKDLLEKFKQAELYVEKHKINLDIDKIKEAIIKGKTIAEAVEEEIERSIGVSTTGRMHKPQLDQKEITSQNECCALLAEYKERIDYLLYTKKKLENNIGVLKAKLEEAEKSYKRILVELKKEIEQEIEADKYKARIRNLEARIRELENKISNLVKSEKMLTENIVLVSKGESIISYYLEKPTIDSLKEIEKELNGLPKRSIFFLGSLNPKDLRFVQKLKEMDVEAIVSLERDSELSIKIEKQGIPFIECKGCSYQKIGSLVFLPARVLDIARKRRLELGSTRLDEEKLELLLKAYRNGLIEKE